MAAVKRNSEKRRGDLLPSWCRLPHAACDPSNTKTKMVNNNKVSSVF